MASRLKSLKDVLSRSAQQVREESAKILRASPTGPVAADYLPMVHVRQESDMKQFLIGCDEDIGGLSRAKLDWDPKHKARFHGHLNGFAPPGAKLGGFQLERSGYAGLRTADRKTIFGSLTWDTSLYNFLQLRIRSPPSSSASSLRYYVNLQTEGPIATDLWQHRLWLGTSGDWEDVMIPFSDFTLTNSGTISEEQPGMLREKVRTVGLSVLMPNLSAGETLSDEGLPFDIGLESIGCTNLTEQEGLIPDAAAAAAAAAAPPV